MRKLKQNIELPLFPEETDGEIKNAKPFLKWAGGKTQLIPSISEILPQGFASIGNLTYIEPFVGSGAVLFWILREFPNVKRAIINDINQDLICAYKTIKSNPKQLIKLLNDLEGRYNNLTEREAQATLFQQIREKFNQRSSDDITHTSFLIFLNKTCFNGLFRVNSRNEFNVPFGKYKNPSICDERTILSVSKALQKVIILNGDFSETVNYINDTSTFFYFDPPYKPISQTSSFNSYAKDTFDDKEQIRLKEFCDLLTVRGCKWVLSNSDVKNVNPDDDFFDLLFKNYNIKRVPAKRSINCDASKRGDIFELLIKNY